MKRLLGSLLSLLLIAIVWSAAKLLVAVLFLFGVRKGRGIS